MTDYSIAGSSGTTGLSHWTTPTPAGMLAAVDPLDFTTNPHGSAGADKWLSLGQLLGIACFLFPSTDTTGATSATAVNAAITAGYKYIRLVPVPGVPWYIEGGQVKPTTASGITIDIAGCFINSVGAGACFDFTDTTVPDTRAMHGGGIIGFGVIDGTLATGNAYGVHIGDIFQLKLEAQVQNFTTGTTSKGWWLDNRNYWTEALSGRLYAFNCLQNIVFDVSAGNTTNTGSFERAGTFEMTINQGNPAYDGLVFQNGAFMQDKGALVLGGNFGTSTSPLTSAAVRITGSTPSGVAQASDSNIQNAELLWGCEVDTGSGTNAPYTIFFGSGVNFIANCTGNIDFGAAAAFQSSNNGGQFVNFVGDVAGDANLPSALALGSTNLADTNQTISATSATAITSVAAEAAAFTAYKIEVYVPHLGAGTTGTFTFGLGGPSIALASLDIELWTGATLTTHTLNSSSATLWGPLAASASQRSLKVTGTIAFSAAGTVTVTGLKSASGSSNVTVDIGAYILLTPLASP